MLQTVKIIVDGKEVERPLDSIEWDDSMSFPRYMPRLYAGERIIEGVDGTMVIIKDYL